MWSGSRDTSSPGGCASSSGAQHQQTAPEDELRRIFSIVDEPQCDDMVVWFYSSLEGIGRKPFDVALLERSGKDTWPTIERPT